MRTVEREHLFWLPSTLADVDYVAERVADLALSHPMVLAVMVRITKPNAISEADAAGVEIVRSKR